MEGVDHVDVVQVHGGGLVGQVHRVLEGQVPHREGLILGVARPDAPAVLLVELAQARGHLAGAGTRRGDDHDGAGGLDVVVFAEAVVGDDEGDVGGVVVDGVVTVDPHAHGHQLVLEDFRGVLAAEAGHHHAAHVQTKFPEGIDEAHHVHVIGDAQVAPALAFLDVVGGDGHHQLGLIPEL